MLILNIIVIDSLNKILKLFSKCILHWPRISQSILFEVKWNIFPNSSRMMNHLLIIQILLYSLCYNQYLLVCYHWLKQCVEKDLFFISQSQWFKRSQQCNLSFYGERVLIIEKSTSWLEKQWWKKKIKEGLVLGLSWQKIKLSSSNGFGNCDVMTRLAGLTILGKIHTKLQQWVASI